VKTRRSRSSADIVIESRIQIGHSPLFRREFAAELLMLAVEPGGSAEVTMARCFAVAISQAAGLVRERLTPATAQERA